jgi:hypothetical protein
MEKLKRSKAKTFKPERFARNLLNEIGFPKSKKIYVKNKGGRLVVRFNQKYYE